MAPNFVGFTTPGHFAIIGAAALTAAATGTMSTAVICLELTGQLSLQLPILVATVAGYLGAKALNPSPSPSPNPDPNPNPNLNPNPISAPRPST